MSWVVFSYTETLYPEYPYLYVLLETDRKSADRYMQKRFGFSDESMSNNFSIFLYKTLGEAKEEIGFKANKHILIVDKSEFGDGKYCSKCVEWYPYAESNQKDGTLICWSCRNSNMLFE